MELSRKVGGGRAGGLVVELARYAGVAREHARRHGLPATLAQGGRFVGARALRPRTVRERGARTFTVGAATLRYELGRYNAAWLNERTVEIAVARHVLSGRRPEDVLEVGNVLSHYGLPGHTVVDKYEGMDGVLNEDILDFRPGRRFDAIVAVSTLEHVRFDEPDQDPEGPARALAAMRALVSDTGVLLATVPLGYNPGLDASIAAGRFGFARALVLRRASADNRWQETSLEDGLSADYGSPYPNGNAVLIGLDGPGSAAAGL